MEQTGRLTRNSTAGNGIASARTSSEMTQAYLFVAFASMRFHQHRTFSKELRMVDTQLSLSSALHLPPGLSDDQSVRVQRKEWPGLSILITSDEAGISLKLKNPL
jgi:hypothetical protein